MQMRRKDKALPTLSSGDSYDSKLKHSKAKAYMKYCVFAIFALTFFKFLLFTEPLDIQGNGVMENVTMVQFETKFGTFDIELYPKHAPKTVHRILHLVDTGYYTSKPSIGFYRNEKKHVLQGGGFLSSYFPGIEGALPVEYSVPSEVRTVVLARSKDAQSGNAEFAINLGNNTLNNLPSMEDENPGYTVFGSVFRGWGTILKICKKMPQGFLSDENHVVPFTKVRRVVRTVPIAVDFKNAYMKMLDEIEKPFVVTIFSKTTCPYCKKAKAILNSLDAEVNVVELNVLPDDRGMLTQDALEMLTGRRTVPNVFVNGNSIGGGDDVGALHNSGMLKTMIEESGALAKSNIETTVLKHSIVVYSKSYCPYCKNTKQIFKRLNIDVHVVELDLVPTGNAIQHYLEVITGQSTVPNVFFAGSSIGGNSDVEALEKSGKLNKMLEDAGVLVPEQS